MKKHFLLALSLTLAACDHKPDSARWQIVEGQYLDNEKLVQATFLLDTHTGSVWYATPKSAQSRSPMFEPVSVNNGDPTSKR